MRQHRLVFLATLLSAVIGCGGGGPRIGACPDDHSCAPSCSKNEQCSESTGEVCSSGLCGQRQATSTDYVACALDADCARGDYCYLGACKHDCLADRDCSGGTVCSSRGRCVTAGSLGQPVPVTSPAVGKVEVSTDFLDFGSSATELKFELRNGGTAAFDYRLLSSGIWAKAEPFEGQVAGGEKREITVAVDRALAAKANEQGGFIAVNTTAGYLRVGVGLATEVTGAWSGSLRVTAPFELGEQVLVVNLNQSGSTLYGSVDQERSPLYPFKSAVGGAVFTATDGDWVTFSFDLSGAPGSLQNPSYPKVVKRHFSFTGKRTGAAILEGEFVESVEGVLSGVQSQIRGQAVFTRSGAVPEGDLPDSEPSGLDVVLVSDPMRNGDGSAKGSYAACTCAAGTDCVLEPLKNGLVFYNQFWQAAQVSGSSPYANMDACVLDPATCNQTPFVDQNLRCAQYWAVAGMSTAAEWKLLDTLEVASDYGLFQGNAYLARALDAWYAPNGGLEYEIEKLADAEKAFVEGLHTPGDNAAIVTPRSMLDPFFVEMMRRLSAGAYTSSTSLLTSSPIQADAATWKPGEPVRRALSSLDAALFAATERADRLRRLGRDSEAAEALRRAAVRTWIDLAALGPAFAASGATWANDVISVRDTLGGVNRRYQQIELGWNLFGYAPEYVPFVWIQEGQGATNYLQAKGAADAAEATWKGIYERLAGQAGVARSYETSLQTISGEITNQLSTITLQLIDICGADVKDIADCGSDYTELAGDSDSLGGSTGSNASQVAQQMLEFAAAVKRVASIEQQMKNVDEAIRIEEERVGALNGVRRAHAAFIRENGEKIYLAERAIRAIGAAQQASHGILGGIADVFNLEEGGFGLAGLIKGVGGAVIDGSAAVAKESYEREKAELLWEQQARVDYDEIAMNDINLTAYIKSQGLQIPTLSIDHAMALLNASQALGRVNGLVKKAKMLLAEKVRVEAMGGGKARYAVQYRVYADKERRLAAEAFYDALKATYLAARALEYQKVSAYPNWSELWRIRTSSEFDVALQHLHDWFRTGRTSQDNRDVLSLRDDILGMGSPLKDATTGVEISPRERFRRFVADPANRDKYGNLHITFSTYNPLHQVFSAAICSDRVKLVGINLIGDSLGAGVTSAYVRLVHGGTTYLRSCQRGTDGTAPLILYDMTANGNGPVVARVHAAINSLTDGQAAHDPNNVELQERAVLASTWELVIDPNDQNEGLEILGLDDIELTFLHTSYTIQW